MSQAILSKLKFQIGADNRQFLSSIQQSQRKIVGMVSFWGIWLVGAGFLFMKIKH